MVFLHPEILWGLWALIIPIIIHLFDLRKTRKIYFPDIRFLREVKQHSSKPLKIKQWLILLARLGFVTFLVLGFAQPIIPDSTSNKIGKGEMLLYIDNSQSMSANENTKQPLLEEAKLVAQEIIDQLPKGQELVIITNDDFYQFLAPDNLNNASEKISSIALSDKAFSLPNLVVGLKEFSRRNNNITDVFIIGDFQKSTTTFLENKLDTTLTYWVSQITPTNTENCVVDSVYLVDTNISKGGNRSIDVIIANTGSKEKEDIGVKIYVGDRQVSASSVSIYAFQKERISFNLGKLEGPLSGYVQLEDYPNTFDNKFYFSLPKLAKVHVLEIVGEEPSDFIKPVFGNESIFSLASNNYQNVENSHLNKADFIIINQVKSPTQELVLELKSLANNGKSILIIPTNEVDLSAYKLFSSQIFNRPNPIRQKLKEPSAQSPFFAAVLEKTTRKYEMPNATKILGWGKDRSALLSFEDGEPYLSEVANNIYLLAGPLVKPFSDLQTHALFVPIMYGLATQSLAHKSKLFNRIQNEYYDLPLGELQKNDLVKLVNETNEIMPNRQRVGNIYRLSFPKEISRVGTYKVDVKDSTKAYLSINLEPQESILAPLSKEEVVSLFGNANVNFLEAYNANQPNVDLFNAGKMLWRYALTICLLFLLMETLLIRFL